MGVYANGHLIYGFIHDDDTEELFKAIQQGKAKDVNTEAESKEEDTDIDEDEEWEDEEESSFEELHTNLQMKHEIRMFSVGYANVDVLTAFSANASAKNFDSQQIPSEDIANTAEYDKRIQAFLTDLGIDPTTYKPGWHLLGYMD